MPTQISPQELASHIKGILDLSISDIATNGLQVESHGPIQKIITAVDFSEQLLRHAIEEKADAVIVHHGIYWGKLFSITGRYHRLITGLIENNIALYGYHLPLDIHSEIGNNVLLLQALGAQYHNNFGDYKGVSIIMAGELKPMPWDDFLTQFKKVVGEPLAVIVPDSLSNSSVTRIGVCSGGGLFGIEEAYDQGCDVYITGDANHTSYHLVKELGLPLICGGHYSTEVWGVRALGERLKDELRLEVKFIDIPTGL